MLDHLALVVFLGLVVYRATRVATTDKVSQPWRDWLLRKVQESGADNRSLARWAYTLLTCPWCLSVHASFVLTALYVWLVLPSWIGWEYLFDAVAVAGAAALMIAVDHRLTTDPGP
jgi:hypothetical protein